MVARYVLRADRRRTVPPPADIARDADDALDLEAAEMRRWAHQDNGTAPEQESPQRQRRRHLQAEQIIARLERRHHALAPNAREHGGAAHQEEERDDQREQATRTGRRIRATANHAVPRPRSTIRQNRAA